MNPTEAMLDKKLSGTTTPPESIELSISSSGVITITTPRRFVELNAQQAKWLQGRLSAILRAPQDV